MNLINQAIESLLSQHRISDLHIHANQPIVARISGQLQVFNEFVTSNEEIADFLEEHLTAELHDEFTETSDVDFAYEIGEHRFRGSALMTNKGLAIVSRVIVSNIPDIQDLGLPPAVHECLTLKDGLVLVTGATGSGKSTSLAAMVDRINQTRAEHIITVEDPIEFVHQSNKSVISQREVGTHTKSFASALKGALRQDPDVILMGELRDYETISMAMTAAETGHLVFATLHTNGAPETVNRLIDAFPPEEQSQARSQLSLSLRLVMTQQLLRKKGGGRIGAFEVMVNTPAISNLIRENKIAQVANIMQTSAKDGMILMDKYIEALQSKNLIEGVK